MRPVHLLFGLTFCCLFALGACAVFGRGENRVIIDTRGVDMEQYHDDLAQCSQFAKQVPVGKQAGTSAAGGAAVGGAVGAILAGGEGAAKGSGTGAVTGAYRGTAEAKREQSRVIKNCLRERGYRVLN